MTSRVARKISAFALVEALMAMAVVAILLYVLFSSFLGTRKAALKTQSSLIETLLARTLLERVVDFQRNNPAGIGQLVLDPRFAKGDVGAEIWAAVAANPSSIGLAPTGQTIFPADSSPLFKNLLGAVMAGSGDASSPPGPASSDIVQKAFTDYVLRLLVERRPRTQWGQDLLASEATTEITVFVYRVSQRNKDGWSPSLTLSTEITTPVESMSTEAAQAYGAGFPLYDAKEAKAALVAKLSEDSRYKSEPWDDRTRQLLASMLLLAQNVRVEQILTQGTPPGSAPELPREQSLSGLIEAGDQLLQTSKTPRVRQQLADLRIREAQTVFDAFKASQYILQEEILKGSREAADELRASLGPLNALKTDLLAVQADLDKVPLMLSAISTSFDPGFRTSEASKLVTLFASAVEKQKTIREQYKGQLQQQSSILLRAHVGLQWAVSGPRASESRVR